MSKDGGGGIIFDNKKSLLFMVYLVLISSTAQEWKATTLAPAKYHTKALTIIIHGDATLFLIFSTHVCFGIFFGVDESECLFGFGVRSRTFFALLFNQSSDPLPTQDQRNLHRSVPIGISINYRIKPNG
jgi:hypothetical protein